MSPQARERHCSRRRNTLAVFAFRGSPSAPFPALTLRLVWHESEMSSICKAGKRNGAVLWVVPAVYYSRPKLNPGHWLTLFGSITSCPPSRRSQSLLSVQDESNSNKNNKSPEAATKVHVTFLPLSFCVREVPVPGCCFVWIRKAVLKKGLRLDNNMCPGISQQSLVSCQRPWSLHF